MAKFFLGQRVRVVSVVHPELPVLRAAVGLCGVVNELGCRTAAGRTDFIGVTLPIPDPLNGRREDWAFSSDQLEPILPAGHKAGDYSFHELMDRCREGLPA